MATYRNIRKVLNLPTLSESPSSGVNGEMYFNTTDLALYIYDGAWKKVTQSALPTNWANATQQAKMQASDVDGALLGGAIAIDTDTLVVGARRLNSFTGAAYVFTRSGTSWSQQAKLTGSDATTNDNFGWSVDISGDTIVVGSKNASSGSTTYVGAVYIYTRSGTSWSQQAKLQPSSVSQMQLFGQSVAISGDTIVIGAEGETNSSGSQAGSVYVYTRSGTSWSQQANFVGSDTAAGDYFGQSVQMENDTIIASASQIGGDAAGAVYVFTRSGTSWSQQAKLTASDAATNDYFGYHSGNSIAISGDTVVVGAYGDDDGGSTSGSAYVFTRSGTSWSQQAKLTASDAAAYNEFGNATAIEGDTIVIGSHQSDNGGFYVDYTGSAYIYTRSGTSWTQVKKIQSSDIQAGDNFGKSVAIYSNTAVAGAWGEDTGANLAGAAYAFTA